MNEIDKMIKNQKILEQNRIRKIEKENKKLWSFILKNCDDVSELIGKDNEARCREKLISKDCQDFSKDWEDWELAMYGEETNG